MRRPNHATPSRFRVRNLFRAAGVAVAAAALLAVGGGVASAHVTVNPGAVTAGSWAKLTFRVPTESATATTVSLQVTLPSDHPFASVSVMQIPGWTAKLDKTRLDKPVTEGRFTIDEPVTSITWTADDGTGILPGEFMEFPISVGPVPDVPSMQFPAAQGYSDGTLVHWDQVGTTGGDEPEHPAPMLTISPAAAGAGAAGAAAAGAGAAGAAGPTVAGVDQPPASDDTARILGIVALVLASVAVLLAAFGLRRRGARPAGGDPAGGSSAAPSAPDGTAHGPRSAANR